MRRLRSQWEVTECRPTARTTLAKLLRAGWEPYAVAGGKIQLRRKVWK